MRRVLKARDRARDRVDARSAVAFPPSPRDDDVRRSYLAAIRYQSTLILESIDFPRRLRPRRRSRNVGRLFIIGGLDISSLLLLT
jgi:hypothetical protein